MPSYEIHIHCVGCDGEHPLLTRVHLDCVPDHKQSIAESFPEGSVPPQLLAIRGAVLALSLKTGKNVVDSATRVSNEV